MPDEQELLQAVIDDPLSDEPRLAYARWCAPQDPLRAEFIRLQIELSKSPTSDPASSDGDDPMDAIQRDVERTLTIAREKELRDLYAATWASSLMPPVEAYTFDRGFVAAVKLPAPDFLDHAGQLFDLAPIVLVTLTDVQAVATQLFASPHLERVRALALNNNGLGLPHVIELTTSPYLPHLWWLDLSWNQIDFDGARLIVSSRHLPRLSFVALAGNPCDPMETVGVEGYAILDRSLPEDGERLEALYGYIPWLHYATDSTADYPPNPLRSPSA